MHRLCVAGATICLTVQSRKHLLFTIICKCVAITATQFSMCKISTIPSWTYSLRWWITVLDFSKGARLSLWCSPVIYMSTALASVFITGTPLAVEPVVFHTIKPHIWLLSCQGCKYLSFFLLRGGNVRIFDSLISDFIRMKYYRILKNTEHGYP